MPPRRLLYPPPANERDFEELCLQLLRVYCNRPQVELFAHRGEAQAGVDIVDPTEQRPFIAAQCKLHNASKGFQPATLRAEIEKARSFQPSLDLYIVMTTAKRTAALQRVLIAVNSEHGTRRLFTVEVMTWDRIESLLQEYSHIARCFYKTIAGESVTRLEDDLASIRASVSVLGQTFARFSGASTHPPVPLVEYAAIGDELDCTSLCGEFIPESQDIIVWDESMDGPTALVTLFRHQSDDTYDSS